VKVEPLLFYRYDTLVGIEPKKKKSWNKKEIGEREFERKSGAEPNREPLLDRYGRYLFWWK
jgi:hypothetical protein